MIEILSLWRSPLDRAAQLEAALLQHRQPNCTSILYSTNFDAMTIYNFGYYATTYPPPPANAALAKMFSDMNVANPYGAIGGTAFIPQQEFAANAGYLTGSPAPLDIPNGGNIVGSGTGGLGEVGPSLYHFVVSPPVGATGPSCFLYDAGTDSYTDGGRYFRSLAFKWSTTSYADICIYATMWNTRAINCTFTDCPVAFSAQANACGLEQCTINYNSGIDGNGPIGPPTTTFAAVVLSATQCFAVGPGEYFQKDQTKAGAPTDTCCISFQSGLEHGLVKDLHISNWSYGITYGINSEFKVKHCMVTNVEFATYASCIYMVPENAAGVIYDQKYTSCMFSIVQDASTPYSVVLINASGGNAAITDIEFVGCTAFQGLSHGYEIKQGQNIQIVGGTSSGNGPSGGAGIAITGNCGACTFIGVNLDASYPNADKVQSQSYAFLCSGSPTAAVLLDSCSMKGYSGSPISITGSPSALLIQNCAGYNDQNTPLNGGTAPGGTTSAATSSTPYYGPSLVIFTNGSASTTFSINGISSVVPAYACVTTYLASPYDTIEFVGTSRPFSFTWLGK